MAEWKKVVVSGSSAALSGLTVDATISGDINGNAATVTTNAALTGDVTSNGSTNATTIANDAVTTIKILDANVTNAKLANDGLMLGTTDISLGATGSSIAGLTLTGAIGSGSFSGSFQGDGSGLTGIPDATDSKFLVYTTGSGTNSRQSVGSGTASGTSAVVLGGVLNTAAGNCSVIAGGNGSTIDSGAIGGFIGGGQNHCIDAGSLNMIGGGDGNCIANGSRNTVSGGYYNYISNNTDTGHIGGGHLNQVTENEGTVSGGYANEVKGTRSGILGGSSNCITGTCSGILGGSSNHVDTNKSFIVGSDISSTCANHTHVNNLTTAGSITGSNICGTGRVQGATMGVADGSSTITGSFAGDGSALTGLPAAAIENYSGGVANRIITAVDGTSVEGEANLTFDGSTLALTGDATISQDLTVSRNLIVQGTASFQSTEDLDIKDRFIRMASGSTSAGDGGIVIQQTNALNGEVFGFDSTATRFGLTGSFDASQNSFTPDAFVSAVVVGGTGETKDDVVGRYVKPGNLFVQDNGDIHIYV